MPIDKSHPDYVSLKQRLRESPKDFVAICGAGLSIPAGLPSWAQLRGHLTQHAKTRASEIPMSEREGYFAALQRIEHAPNLWDSFTEIRRLLGEQSFCSAIFALLSADDSPAPNTYKLLWKLAIKGVISFNVDNLIANAFASINGRAVDSATAIEPHKFSSFLFRRDSFLFQPHGVLADAKSWVFTSDDRAKLLSNEPYKKFMATTLNSKHALIIGFNPDDFAFEYLIQDVLISIDNSTLPHYIFLPKIDPGQRQRLANYGIRVIPYEPSNPLHPEIEESLLDILRHNPLDREYGSVFSGAPTSVGELPAVDDLLRMPIDEARTLLNKAIASIIPPNATPTPADIQELESFYNKNIRVIHQAWLVSPNTECDILHGYKVTRSVGRGAFAQVYEAVKSDCVDKKVAIKVLLPEVRSDRGYLSSFRRGVHSMRILEQRQISGTTKIQAAYEVPACVIMEFIDGYNLSDAKRHNCLDTSADSTLKCNSGISQL